MRNELLRECLDELKEGELTVSDFRDLLMDSWPLSEDELIEVFHAARSCGCEDIFFDVVTAQRDFSVPKGCVVLTREEYDVLTKAGKSRRRKN